MDAVFVLQTIARLLALLALVQSYEFIVLARAAGADGVWRWRDIEAELSGGVSVLKKTFGFFLSDQRFYFLNILRALSAFAVLFNGNYIAVTVLFALHVLTLLRWLGTFNGGSDYMSLLLLLMVSVGLTWPTQMAEVCLWYISFQLCLSYFKAGWFKLKNVQWRNGTAVADFLTMPIYEQKYFLNRLMSWPPARILAAWAVIVYEVTFPISIFSHKIAAVYMALGVVFHLGNAYVFGLNRFVFAWVAAYPALYYCSGRL